MVIAIPYDKTNGEVGQHFGKADAMKLYEIDDVGNIIDQAVVKPYGTGHELMCDFLMDYNTELVLCRHMGEAAYQTCRQNGIDVIMGVEGKTDDLMREFLETATFEVSEDAGCPGCGDGCGSDCSSGCGGCCGA